MKFTSLDIFLIGIFPDFSEDQSYAPSGTFLGFGSDFTIALMDTVELAVTISSQNPFPPHFFGREKKKRNNLLTTKIFHRMISSKSHEEESVIPKEVLVGLVRQNHEAQKTHRNSTAPFGGTSILVRGGKSI